MAALGVLSRKIGMTQIFDEDRAVGATVFEVEPCTVVQVKRTESDGYDAIQLGCQAVDDRKLTRSMKGHFDSAGIAPCRYLFEVRLDGEAEYEVGDQVGVDIFSDGESVEVTGMSRGLGFQGVVKRWNFSGGPKTHGSHFHRRPGSVGNCVEPGRVVKGKKLPGHTGDNQVTVKGLEVLQVDSDKNLLIVKGPVPGPRGSMLQVRKGHG